MQNNVQAGLARLKKENKWLRRERKLKYQMMQVAFVFGPYQSIGNLPKCGFRKKMSVFTRPHQRESDNPLDLRDFMDGGGADIEVFEDAVVDPVDPAMDGQFLA